MILKLGSMFFGVSFLYSQLNNKKLTTCKLIDRTTVSREVKSKDLPSYSEGTVSLHKGDTENRVTARKNSFRKAISGFSKNERETLWKQYQSQARYVTTNKAPFFYKPGKSNTPLSVALPTCHIEIEFGKHNTSPTAKSTKDVFHLLQRQLLFHSGSVQNIEVTCVVKEYVVGSELPITHTGTSVCMYTDHFDGIYGRKLALRRAIKSFSKEDRKAIWKVYLSSTRQILRNKPKENSIFS